MSELIEASLRFPTVVFTILLGIATLYWLSVLIGALDIDLLGGGDASGAAKGVGEVLTGGGKAGAEALKGAKLDLDGHGGGIWSGLGLGKVPVTISVSMIALVAWCGSLLAMHHLPALVGDAAWLPATVLLGTLVAAMPIAALLVRPLHPIFELKEGKSGAHYVGYTCTITTGRVDAEFGQARIEDGGTVLDIPVRCDRTDVFARGDKALIIEFDPARHAYVVVRETGMLPAASGDEGSSAQSG